MNGTILHIDHENGNGAIKGKDGNRYNFSSAHVAGEMNKLRHGARVDFIVTDGQANEIFPDVADGSVSAQKSKLAAALLALFAGGLGVHKFYLGKSTAGIIMLAGTICGIFLLFIPNIIIGIISLIEAITYLVKSEEDFYDQYIAGDKAWF